MKVKVLVRQFDQSILLAFIAASLAFLFAVQSHAENTSSKAKKAKHAKLLKHSARRVDHKLGSIVLPDPSLASVKQPASSVMFLNLSERKLIAQNDESATLKAKAIDAKLEGEVLSDSKPVAAPVSVSKLATEIKTEEKPKDLQFKTQLVVDTYWTVNNADTRTYSGEYTLVPSVKYSPWGLAFGAKIAYSRNYSETDDYDAVGDFNPVTLVVSKKVTLSGVLDDLSFGPIGIIPAGKDAERATLRGGTGFKLDANKKLGPLNIEQAAYYVYRFYEYDIRDDGTVNSPHQLVSVTDLTLETVKNVSLVAEFAVQQLINFQNTKTAQTSTQLGLEYDVSKNFSVLAGVGTPWTLTLADNGQRSRAVLYDAALSQGFFELGITF